ncbi:MAG: type II toxin-antitoxin system HipA family toxin [Lachnospiraceae bacterium]|nr:type II toxin-antitoxin system HipA family toxin [Lachnospiraceae bacterium]
MTAADVYLWGTLIGTVVQEDNGIARFQYHPDFRSSGIEVSPLMMPLSGSVYSFPELAERTFHGLPGLLADSLPDKFGNAVIDAWLTAQGRSPASFGAVERLCYTGKRGMGALEYVPSIGPDPGKADTLRVERLVALASDILNRREKLHVNEKDHAAEQIIRVGTSAGGARAKAVIAWDEKTGDIRAGQVEAGSGYSYWLMKFDGIENNRDKENADDPQYTRIEYAYYLMAQKAGILMNECRIFQEGERRHFLTRRFDRVGVDGEKLHMQTLGAIAHLDFNMPGACSYEYASEVMRRLYLGQDAAEELYRRMVFHVMARNQDDHVKNLSFLMNRHGQWRLAPAYDETYAYQPGGLWTGSHQMTINGKRNQITKEDCIAAGRNMNLRPAKCREIMEEVQLALDQWPAFAARAELAEAKAMRIAEQFERL